MKESNALDNHCPSCRAPLTFNPTLGKWKCEYCGSSFDLEELKKYNNASNEKVNEGINGDDTEYDSYRCQNCGAEIVADPNTASTFCLYCGNTAILKSKLSGKFAPSKVIPFKKIKEDAVKAFKGLKKGRPLIPNDFISDKNIEKITGLYVPFWLYDIAVKGSINATATNVKSWTTGDMHYTKTDTYSVIRGGSMEYNMVPRDGSTRFADDIMDSIEPFDYKEMVDYNHAYLSGFLAEKYDIDSDKCSEDAIKRSINSTVDEMKKTIHGYSTVSVTKNNLVGEKIKCEYALLPVWMVNVKYNDKFYLFAMNGQTGEFIGNIPLDKKKTLIYTLSIFAITLVLSILISYLVYMGA